MRARRRLAAGHLYLVATLLAGSLAAAPWKIDDGRSSFVVLTHPEGIAGGLAHPHVIVAIAPGTALDFDPAHPEATRFTFREPVLALEVDAPASRFELAARLREVGALTEPLKVISESTRGKIRRDMLDADQLFAERFPEIRASLTGLVLRPPATTPVAGEFEATAKMKFEIRGMAVEKEIAVHAKLAGGELHVHLLGELAFTQFGFKPYSALLGAIRNADRFHLYVELLAIPASAPPTPATP